MEKQPSILKTYFTCDESANVNAVLKDDFGIFRERALPLRLFELFDHADLENATAFWMELLTNNKALIARIPVSLLNISNEIRSLNGFVAPDEILIKITSEKCDSDASWVKTMSGNDRSIHKSLSPGIATSSIASDNVLLNDLSSLNNELINLQRKMMQQSMVIAHLSKKLETNDQRFQILSRAINDAIWDWNIVDDTIEWNQRLSAIYGYSQNQYPKTLKDWAANIHPEDRAEAMSALEETLAHARLNWKFIYRYRSSNGIYKYTFDRGFVVYVGNQPVRMISVMQDIDERMASLQEIEKLSLVASKTDNLVIITDKEEKIEWVNEGFIKKTGYTLNEVIGKTPSFLLGPETDPAALDLLQSRIDAKESVTQEILNYTKDGRKFWVKVNINPVFDDRNKLVNFVAVETDITLHKDFENKITAIANDLTNLIATVNAPIFGMDKNGDVNEWNNLASDLTEYTKNEILGKQLIETLVDETSRPQILEKLITVFDGNPLSNLELPILSKSGKKIIILINATPRKNAQNEVESVFLVGQDITELTQYRQSLEEKVSERTKDLEAALIKERELVSIKTRFASMVSHEFRTPLSTIKLSANHVRKYRTRLQPDEIDSKLEIIQEQVAHMTHMLEDVLAIGKSEAGKIELNRSRLNISDFLHVVKGQVENQFKNSHKIHCSVNTLQPEILADADLLRNIFVNLLSNAVKFSPGKSDVFVKAFDHNTNLVFEVIDQGIGILPEDAHRIFTPFDRGTNTTSIPGTGLGLSIVKKAIELMRGDITFHSTSAGTTFSVVLPKGEL